MREKSHVPLWTVILSPQFRRPSGTTLSYVIRFYNFTVTLDGRKKDSKLAKLIQNMYKRSMSFKVLF